MVKNDADMAESLKNLVPKDELKSKAELVREINKLKRERNAVILGHNYMEPTLYHFVADITGDSLELCRKAAEAEQDVIVFCGVKFMAESAKIINPTKTVLLPSLNAGCSLAGSITGDDVRRLKEKFPGVPVVSYVNTYADVKAETDVCCTSSNASKVLRSLGTDTVIFLPDEFLAQNVAKETGMRIIFPKEGGDTLVFEKNDVQDLENKVIGWHGKCEVHDQFTVKDIEDVRKNFPSVVVLAHPECPPEVVDASDFSGSTSAMIKYVEENQADHYLLLTECSMADNIIAEHPDKGVLRMCSVRCPHMGQITLEETLSALKNMQHEITLPAEMIEKARHSIDRMLEIG